MTLGSAAFCLPLPFLARARWPLNVVDYEEDDDDGDGSSNYNDDDDDVNNPYWPMRPLSVEVDGSRTLEALECYIRF